MLMYCHHTKNHPKRSSGTIIGTVFDHLQSNQMIQIWSIVQKSLLGHVRQYWAPSDSSEPNSTWWLMVLDHSSSRFRPFTVKSKDSNLINSPSHFWDIFGHIGHSQSPNLINSPKNMFLQFFRFFRSVRGSKK